jgi:hypothetical protein
MAQKILTYFDGFGRNMRSFSRLKEQGDVAAAKEEVT